MAANENIAPASVEITENMGEWFVRVVQNGAAHISTFEVESYARAFAEGKRPSLRHPAGANENRE
ncbi:MULTISPECIES: hypothetical protein [Mesorhizobium]|uniref:Uncharacterized protein n=1 Tax=Mesorhizobium temperatum TaxID=241416 RepID=A0A271LNZ3_9HYPH|nr:MULTISPECIES: hypothetical protein [Mesorhizobium]PAQ09809.1 hypothetical protein CIT26_11065 [Mesorhizobium temperatum]